MLETGGINGKKKMENNTGAKIGIGVKNGRVLMKVQIGKLNQAELSMLITHLELLKDDLKLNYRKSVKTVKE